MDDSRHAGSFPYLPPNTGQGVTSSASSEPLLTSSFRHQSVQASRSAPLGSGTRSQPAVCSSFQLLTGGVPTVSSAFQISSGSLPVETGQPYPTGSLISVSNSSWPVSQVTGGDTSLAPATGAWSAPTTGQYSTSGNNRDSGSSSSSGGSSGKSGRWDFYISCSHIL